jgi:hypothetical protein
MILVEAKTTRLLLAGGGDIGVAVAGPWAKLALLEMALGPQPLVSRSKLAAVQATNFNDTNNL